MLAKISELTQCKSFTVKELTGVTITPEGRTGGKVISEYKFQYDTDTGALHVSGDVFGDKLHMVQNQEQLLFQIAKGLSFKAVVSADHGDIEFDVFVFDVDINK